MIINLNVKAKTIKLLENLCNPGFGNVLHTTQKAWKETTDKLDFRKMKNFCFSKVSNMKVKRQTMDWEKTVTKYILSKDWEPTYIKNLQNSTRKQLTQHKQHAKIRTDTSPKIHSTAGKEHMKRCLTSLVIRNMWIKTTMKHHYGSIRVTQTKTRWSHQTRWGCGVALTRCWWGGEMVQPLWETICQFFLWS